jgi:hypothetical protein
MVLSWIKGPPQIRDAAAEAQLQKDLEKIRGDIEYKKREMELQFKAKQEEERRHELAKEQAEQNRIESDREYRQKMKDLADEKLRAELNKERIKEQQRQNDRLAEMEKKYQEKAEDANRKLEEKQRALDAAQQNQIRVQAQPTYVTPPVWHPRYYWWW